MCNLDSIEKRQNIKFPKEYRRLYKSEFYKNYNNIEIHAGNEVFCIRKFLTAIDINNILEEFFGFFGYDMIPIAETNYDDYICLYYKEDGESPSVVYWDYELVLENPEEGILLLYDNMYEFEAELKKFISTMER